MILSYFGETYDPVVLKKHAEERKPKAEQNSTFTYWKDMRWALRMIGKNWAIADYPKTTAGFESGLRAIKRSLRAGNPVMIEVHLGAGHTFVVTGYNDEQQIVYIRDPDIPASRSRIISYAELLESWHAHRFGNFRSAFFSKR